MGDLKCALSSMLILRYPERVADHATYVGEMVEHVATDVEPSSWPVRIVTSASSLL
ncbi:MAG: PhoU domain-containing protein [Nitrososphaerota archaeon]|nr:PhoU domain-containing protein [Nitrososphaerota archaeon]